MLRKIAALLACIALGAFTASAQAPPAAPKTTLIKAGRMLEVRSGSYLANQGILIEGETIKQIGPLAEIERRAPQDAVVIDLSKATVLPGLIDCHAHLLDAMDARLNLNEALIMTIASMSPAQRVLLGAAMAREDLEAGFTTVRNVGHSGIDGDVALRDAVNNGWVPGPRIVAAARKLTPPGGQAIPVQYGMVKAFVDQEFLPVNGAESARAAVREDLRVGADVIKVVVDVDNRILGEDEMKAIVAEAHRGKVRVAAHATTAVGIEAAVNAGVDSIEHGDEATDESLKRMREKGIFLDPTAYSREEITDLFTRSRLMTEADKAGINAWLDKYIPQQKSLIDRARKLGVKMVAGSDMWFAYPGKTRGQATLGTLEAMQKHGMPPIEVLRATTIHAAELLGWQERVGSIEAGKFADLIALEGDPLRDVGELAGVKFVMKGGAVVKNQLAGR